ncbi:MAG TPA: hypothetical protein VMV19_15225, partial [Xanthobacteraceae bacterium]|nr:hypothetical protein [Xanthobacteraceae bacterium]
MAIVYKLELCMPFNVLNEVKLKQRGFDNGSHGQGLGGKLQQSLPVSPCEADGPQSTQSRNS